jgi:hypothetical protein
LEIKGINLTPRKTGYGFSWPVAYERGKENEKCVPRTPKGMKMTSMGGRRGRLDSGDIETVGLFRPGTLV